MTVFFADRRLRKGPSTLLRPALFQVNKNTQQISIKVQARALTV